MASHLQGMKDRFFLRGVMGGVNTVLNVRRIFLIIKHPPVFFLQYRLASETYDLLITGNKKSRPESFP